MFTVYILRSEKTGRYYIGYTSNFEQRLLRHDTGKNKSTKSGTPWVLIYKEQFENKRDAWLREHQLKSYKGGKAFKKLISKK